MNKLDMYENVMQAFLDTNLNRGAFELHKVEESQELRLEVYANLLDGAKELKHFAGYFEKFLINLAEVDEKFDFYIGKTYYDAKISILHVQIDLDRD